MPISVVCPGCKSRFQVSEKFAGKQGPCPKCKKVITVPEADAVKIHVPDEFEEGGRDAKGKLVGKPIKRKEAKITPLLAGLMAAAVVAVIAVAGLMGTTIAASWPLLSLGLLVVSPPICMVAYAILRNDELEPYSGASLWIRVSICALVYILLWGAYGMLHAQVAVAGYYWIVLAIPFLAVAGVAAYSTLDLTFENAVIHYLFYLLLTMGLRWLVGLGFVWEMQSTVTG
ncbi:MAG: hypothetical protein KDA63_07025 [Planctomycetales bacterium]|nr:hypothetical protein [Planctomycetales bacterium]